MILPSDLPETIPLFPLPGGVLLPRARLPLHVFEPRYLALLDDALRTASRLIGIVQPVEKDSETLHQVGCLGRVTSFTETDDNRYMITLTGVSRFRIEQLEDGFTPYKCARISWAGFEHDSKRVSRDPSFDRQGFLGLLQRYFDLRDLSTDWEQIQGAEEDMLVNSLSMLCPFSIEEKQALLEAENLAERRRTLTALLEYAIYSNSDDEVIQ
ncbi:LON peptidase substrate-binding domain-containing protein [Halocynthiibacter sp.]|uniref:LON peptidase substrate-binding domain-containing protein n=1 Tax=Halocynthiibacter sp. TaxID=1979210 RepID=UPI003C574D98